MREGIERRVFFFSFGVLNGGVFLTDIHCDFDFDIARYQFDNFVHANCKPCSKKLVCRLKLNSMKLKSPPINQPSVHAKVCNEPQVPISPMLVCL
jgi:hypothetical protein